VGSKWTSLRSQAHHPIPAYARKNVTLGPAELGAFNANRWPAAIERMIGIVTALHLADTQVYASNVRFRGKRMSHACIDTDGFMSYTP
jgi:hypothetical protein